MLETDATYYDDIKRYSYLREDDADNYRRKELTYAISADEYGSVISGLAPMYSVEGAFVGMLGVDIYIEEYENELKMIRNILLYVFFLPTAILTAVYIILYIKNRKLSYSTAYADPLTSAKNRRFIEKYFPAIVREHHKKNLPLSVIMIDIDNFKLFNDTYGHPQGDKVLVKISGAVNSVLRKKEDHICRYGGEEFFVILTNTKLSDAERIAGRIKTAVTSLAIKNENSGAADVVTVSQGVYSIVPKKADCCAEFIERADKGLYDAKHNGRDRYVLVEAE
jgi:diguanylate cyclase (GGDEF)-like protein